MDHLQADIESLENERGELKKLLKTKQEELSEMQIEKLNRKLEDAQILLKRKEKEFEETMDHLQADIESLENERGELKDKMKAMSKKALIEGLTKSVSLSPGGPTSLGPSVPSPVRDSPLLVQQLQDMRTAMSSLQTSVARMEVQELSARLAALPKIPLPASTTSTPSSGEKQDQSKDAETDLGSLMSRCNKARQELYSLMANQTVVDVTRSKEFNLRKVKEAELRREVEQLQTEMLRLMTS